MSKSLQEQLLQSGLAKPKQAKKARQDKAREKKKARRNRDVEQPGARLDRKIDIDTAAKREYDRRLNAERQAQRDARERDAAATQIIDTHRIAPESDSDAAVVYNYTDRGKIKRLRVSDAQRRKLAAGDLAIVRYHGKVTLVSAAVAKRLQPLIPKRIWQVSPETQSPVDPDDPYAAFQVPDDLMW